MNDGTEPPESLASRIAGLSPAKRALLELRLRNGGRGAAATAGDLTPIPARSGPGPAPLSFAQQRLWFLDRLEPGSALYTVPSRAWLTGRLNLEALQRALQAVVDRHESLRTVFPSVNGEPVQIIRPSLRCELPVVDLRELPPAEREAEVERRIAVEASRPFDLAQDILLRPSLLRLAEEEHALILIVHHIVCDGWSLGVLYREIGTLYDAFARGVPASLPDLPIQYADYAIWQRARLEEGVLNRDTAYWKQQFSTVPAPLQLPTDHPRVAAPRHRGGRVRFELPAELVARLSALGLREGATLYMTLLAAFQTLLSRYSGRKDIVVGSPIAGRSRPETETLIGFFINTLALRTDLSGEPSFLELLRRVREVALDAFAHQELPFERVVQEIQPERGLSHSPLFQVMFALQNAPRVERSLTGLTLRHIELDKGTAKFDLGLALAEHATGVRAAFSFDTDLFDRSTVERFAGHYQMLLRSIAADPGRPVSRLPILGDEERRRVLVALNATQLEYPRAGCLHQLFEQQASLHPDAVALAWVGGEHTYRELNRRANRLARRLQALGVGPEVRVGLHGERSPGMIAALLAVLKAGGAYVPFDGAQPPERLSQMLADADVRVLLISSETARAGLPDPLPATLREVLLVDRDEDRCDDADENLASGAAPANAAYVLYTSGSTGRPKGVVVSHRAVVNLGWAAAREYRIGPDDRVLQAAELTSDFSVEEIFPAWLGGAAVVLREPGPMPLGPDYMDLLERTRATMVLLPTAFWHAWVEHLHHAPRPLPLGLRIVSIGGEKVQPGAYARWKALDTSRIRWFNTYGPTETTVEATLHEPEGSGPKRSPDEDLPIGRPIANTRVYLLDRYMEPVPIGVPGELYVGGSGVARGYLGRPGMTAERFLPDPFSAEPGARFYRTGDTARWRADGTLEFGGRLDRQVKVRGFRVEPGEIEAVLGALPGIRACAVAVRQDAAGGALLVAYIVPQGGTLPANQAEELRSALRQHLPDHMIPADFLILPDLPLTPGGKVDYRQLPTPERTRPEGEARFEAPRTPLEDAIARVWASVLGIDRVGVNDNFFRLGGHSLMAVQVILRLHATVGAEVPVRVLFEAPTVAGVAGWIESRTSNGAAEAAPPLVRLPRTPPRSLVGQSKENA